MGLYGDTSQPATPVYNNSYQEGVQAEINAIPTRLAAEAAARRGGQYVRGPDGSLQPYTPPTALPQEYRDAYAQARAEGDERSMTDWLRMMRRGMDPNDPNGSIIDRYLETGDTPPSNVVDFGGGDRERADLDIENYMRMMNGGQEAANRYEQQRLQQELNLLPQFNDLNIDMQNRTYDAANNALDRGERQRLTREQELRPGFDQVELDSQRRAFNQNLDLGDQATRRQTLLQQEILPQLNRLGLNNQVEAYMQGLGLSAAGMQKEQETWDAMHINERALRDQDQAFNQALDQNNRGASQTLDLQQRLLPLLNSLGLNLQGEANSRARADGQTNARMQADLQAELLPMLNRLGLGMQDEATTRQQDSDAQAFDRNLQQGDRTAQRAYDLTQQMAPGMNRLTVANQAAANAQSRQDATAATLEQQRLQELLNPSTQRMAMANQSEANANSLRDSATAYNRGMELQAQQIPELNRMNLAAQGEADQMSQDRSAAAVQRVAQLGQDLMPQINRANLGMQREADEMSQSQSAAAARRGAALQQELMPQLNNMTLENQAAGRRAALASIKETDGTRYNTRENLGQQVMGDLALGDQLSEAQSTRLQNRIRASQAARGNVLGGAASVQEALAETEYGDNLKAQRQAAARDFVNMGDILPQFDTMRASNPVADWRTDRSMTASQIADPTAGFDVNRQFSATQGQNMTGLFNPQTGYQGAGVGNAAQAYNAQTGVQAFNPADPMSAFNVNSNTVRGGNYSAQQVGNSAALFNPQSGYSAMGVNNTIGQVGPMANAASRPTGGGFFGGANLSAAQPINPILPNFQTSNYQPTAPNFQATTTGGPNLAQRNIQQSGAFNFTTNGAGQAGVQSANSNWSTLSNINSQNRQNMTGAIGSGIGALAGMFM